MALTRRQRQVLDVIRDFILTRGYSPSLEEIASSLGLSSVATVHKHVSLLAEKGYVQRAWNQNRSIELLERDTSPVVRLPLYGTIPAGAPHEAVAERETIDVPASFVRKRDTTYVLRVRGDSMIDEQIRDGDFVIVERRESASEGDTVVALIDGEDATLKRFHLEGTEIHLEPANARLQPIVLPAHRVQIQGVAVGVLRRYW